MNLSLKEFKVDENLAYKITKMDFCCDTIKECSIINLETENDYTPRISICQSVEYYIDGDSYPTFECTPIKFCPFCGKKIKIEIVDKEDVSEYYDELQDKETKLRIKSREIDSRKKSDELTSLARELSDELNYYLTNDSIHMFIA